MKICIVGSVNTIFVHCYIKEILSSGHDVCFVNTGDVDFGTSISSSVNQISTCSGLFENNKKSKISKIAKRLLSKLKRLSSFCYLYECYSVYRSKKYDSDKLKRFILKEQPDIILFFWCTTTRKETFLISNLKRNGYINSKLIMDVGTYPVRDYVKESYPSYLFNIDIEYFSLFDYIFSHSKVLDEFLINKLKVNARNIVRYICGFPKESFGTYSNLQNNNKLEHRSKLVFLGGINKDNIIDDVRSQIEYLTKLDIDVYVQKSDVKIENVSYFEPFTFEQILSGDLTTFVNQFDGILMLYGDMSRLRQKLTYPTRYALAALSKVPIFMKRGVYDSLEELSNDNVFLYNNLEDISDKLRKNSKSFSCRTEENTERDLISIFKDL